MDLGVQYLSFFIYSTRLLFLFVVRFVHHPVVSRVERVDLIARLLTAIKLTHATEDIKRLLISWVSLFHNTLLAIGDQFIVLLLVKGELAVNL